MKKLLLWASLLASVSLVSAQTISAPTNWQGIYKSVIWSLDSDWMQMSVKLNSDNTYNQTITNFNKDWTKTTSTKGWKFTWLDKSVITLDDNSTSYAVASDRLMRINVPQNVTKVLWIDYYTLPKSGRVTVVTPTTSTTTTKKAIPVLANVAGWYGGSLKCDSAMCDSISTTLVLNSNWTYYKRNLYVWGERNGQTDEKRWTYTYRSLVVTLDEWTKFRADWKNLYVLWADGSVISTAKLDGYMLSK